MLAASAAARNATALVMISTEVMGEGVEYPEEGTVRMLTRGPFDQPKPEDDPNDRLILRFNRSDAVE